MITTQTKEEKLTGLEKASILLTSLGAAESSKVFAQLSQDERETLGAQIVTLRHVSSVTHRSVMDEVAEYVRYGKSSPVAGNTQASAAAGDEPFKWLEGEEPEFAALVLERERPQNVALALAHVTPNAAADILSCLRENLRNQVAHRLATIKSASPEVVRAADQAMRDKALGARKSGESTDGSTLARIIENATQRVRSSVMGVMSGPGSALDAQPQHPLTLLHDRPGTAERRETPAATRLTPEDITALSDEDIRGLISETRIDDLCMSLQVASDELKNKVLGNMFDEAAQDVRRELQSSANCTIAQIGNAQDRIMDTMRRLHQTGAIGRVR